MFCVYVKYKYLWMNTNDIRLIWEGTCQKVICLTWARCSHWHVALWSPFHTEATRQTLLTTSIRPPESSYELTEWKKAVKKSKEGKKKVIILRTWQNSVMETILPSEDFQLFQSSSKVICWSSWWSLLCLFACCCCCISSMMNYSKKQRRDVGAKVINLN